MDDLFWCRRRRHWPLVSRPRFEVATWPVGNWCRDPILRSRPYLFGRAEGRSRRGIDIATWLGCPGGHDLEMMSRPGLGMDEGRRSQLTPTTWALSTLPAHAESATCVGCARDMRSTWALCTRPMHAYARHGRYARSARALCTQPDLVQCTVL